MTAEEFRQWSRNKPWPRHKNMTIELIFLPAKQALGQNLTD
jgi:hypothetical protein